MRGQGDRAVDEWKECRHTIGRFDGILADIRKYGFTLVTALLTANALVTTPNPDDRVAGRVASSGVIMALILVLFLLDRYNWVLLRRTVQRARQLEQCLGIRITNLLGSIAERSGATHLVSAVYALFVVVAVSIALIVVVPNPRNRIAWTLAALLSAGLVLVLMVAVHIWVTIQLKHPLDEPTPGAPRGPDWTTVLSSAAVAGVVVGVPALVANSRRSRHRRLGVF